MGVMFLVLTAIVLAILMSATNAEVMGWLSAGLAVVLVFAFANDARRKRRGESL